MSELDRIIGRLENGFESVSARLKKIERKLDKLDEDYHHRQGVNKFLMLPIGMLGGAITHIITKLIGN